MISFEREYEGVYRLKIPFETLYTSVFLILADRPILVDCATTAEDVERNLLPALEAVGYGLTDISMLVLTHQHTDHAGGLSRILELAPEIRVICGEICQISDGIFTYPMAGHTADCIGVLDEAHHTLLSGDGLQGAGVDKYRCNVKSQEDYLETLTRIRNDERIERILLSHAYEPWYSDRIEGREAVLTCLAECKKYLKHYEGNLS